MLALIAGTGALPRAVAEAQSVRPLICGLEGALPDQVDPDLTFRVERLAQLFRRLRKRGVTRICLCGSVGRPRINPWSLGLTTLPMVPRMLKAQERGDDGALRIVIGLFEDYGFRVEAAHVAAPSLVPPSGVLGRIALTEAAQADGTAGDAALHHMGAVDLGQACIVKDGLILATETDAGTDALINDQGQAGSVLFKAPKPGQDRRVDLPTIGPDTARNAIAKGLGGIIIEAGGVIVLKRAELVGIMDQAGLYLWSRERPV